MTAFRQVVGKLQQANHQEAMIGLEFVLRLDPEYAPALTLQKQLASGAEEIDLDEVLSQLQAPTTDAIDNLLVEAVEAFNERDFASAREKVEQVLLDLPGHQEARQLLHEIEQATKGDTQVHSYLEQAQAALDAGDSQEAANFVMMAQALDPHHAGIAEVLARIEGSGDVSLEQAGFAPFEAVEADQPFPATDDDAPDFSTANEAASLFDGELEETAASEPESEPFASANEPSPPSPQPAESGAAADDEYYAAGMEDVSDLFEEPAAAFDDPTAAVGDGSDTAATIRALLARGGAAAAEDDFAAAIDHWSRILLIDPDHEEARDRIEHIRHAKEDVDQRIEPMLTDAVEAFEAGNTELASDFIDRILELSPRHVEATRLAETIGRPGQPSAEGDASSDMPDLEDDLFSDEFSAIPDFGAEAEQRAATLEGEWRTPKKPKRKLPWQVWAAIGGAAIVIVGFSLWVGSQLLPEEPQEARIDVVNRVLVEATELFNTGRVDEAILLLEQNSANDIFQKRIDERLAQYRREVATPVPTPVPEGLAACRALLEEGRWMAAYARAMQELKLHPNDPGLEAVRQQVLEHEPEARPLWKAMADGDYRAAVGIARDLLDTRPDDREVVDIYERSLFNAGMTELRAFNLNESERFISELAERHPDDDEVQRVLQFINTYKSRPADMQLEIFVGSIPMR